MNRKTVRQIIEVPKSINLPRIIQGGMGIGVSGWTLARAVSTLGQLGVVSGTGINTVMIRRLQNGDPQGDVRRAIASFPDEEFSAKVLKTYFFPEGRSHRQAYKPSSLPSIDSPLSQQRLNTLATFVEVFLAKENHDGIVGINFLEKIQISNLSGIYGAMLAGVDYVLMGAGIPREIPGVLDSFSEQKEASIKVTIVSADPNADVRVSFDPTRIFPEMTGTSLKRPKFLPIVSSAILALHLLKKSNGDVNGFVIEGPLAGGHNAPPRGPLQLNERGEPIYGSKDEADLNLIRETGLPFWLAGSQGTADKLQEALRLGASGVQVGTAFAFCNESGLSERLRREVIEEWCPLDENPIDKTIFTDPFASPTGFPFKVIPLRGTLSEKVLYENRSRKCDLGYLRQAVQRSDGNIIYRCPAEPVDDYLRKGGKIEDTVNRKCLCNALMSNIGLGQVRENDSEELPLLTAGNDLSQLKLFLPKNQRYYSAKDVVSYLLETMDTSTIN